MLIKELELNGFKWFFLSKTKRIVYKPSHRINIILGRGGCGKSSLLRELTPLPANIKRDFSDGGYKRIVIEHKNSEYVLISGQPTASKHSFIVDGVDLNDGGTRRVQLMLVEEHFGITPLIHEVMLGTTEFTNMSPSARKEWVMQSSDIDYDYVMNIFNKLKQEQRDVVGAHKLAQTELANGIEGILAPDAVKEMRETMKYFNSAIDKLFDMKHSDVKEEIKDREDIIISTTLVLEKLIKQFRLPENVDVSGIGKEITATETRIKDNLKNQEMHTKELRRLKEFEATISLGDAKDIEKKIHSLNGQIDSIKGDMYIECDLSDIPAMNELFKGIMADFTSVLDELSDTQEDNVDKDTYHKLKKKLNDTNLSITLTKKEIENLESKKRLLDEKKNGGETECPKCHHTWVVGYDDLEYKNVTNALDKASTTNIKRIDLVEKLSRKIERIDARNKTIKDLSTLMNNYSRLNPIWQYLLRNRSAEDMNYSVVKNEAERLYRDMVTWSKVTELIKKKQQYENDLSIVMVRVDAEVKHIGNALDQTSHVLHDLVVEEKRLKDVTNLLKKAENDLNNINSTAQQLRQLIRLQHNKTKNDIKLERNKVVSETIRHLRLEITRIENDIHASSKKQELLNSKRGRVEDLEKQAHTYELLVNSLSPNNGIIAKSIVLFLNNFIRGVNTIINTVWNYRMDILPCKIDAGDDLDYKFPIVVEDNEPNDDIKTASSSMREIINLAFKIVSMKYMGMERYPLYLDEYGRTMDDAHRAKAFDTIDTLADSSFNQIFIVSHFASSYSKFANAGITVLDPENLLLNHTLQYNSDIVID